MPSNILDSSKLREMGWRPTTSLYYGLVATYNWFLRMEEKDAAYVR